MIVNYNNFVNESFKDMFKSKDTKRSEKLSLLLMTAQEDGAFMNGGLSERDRIKFIVDLMEITKEFGYGKGIKNLSEYIDSKVARTSSRVQDFWMDISDCYSENFT